MLIFLASVSLLLISVLSYAQRTGDEERAGWYASNPWMIGVLLIPLLALLAIAAFVLIRRRKL